MTVLGKTSPAETRAAHATILRDITTGEVIARRQGLFTRPWADEIWACNAIASHFDVSDDSVKVEDTDDGRFYSVDGKPVAAVDGEYDMLMQILAAARNLGD